MSMVITIVTPLDDPALWRLITEPSEIEEEPTMSKTSPDQNKALVLEAFEDCPCSAIAFLPELIQGKLP